MKIRSFEITEFGPISGYKQSELKNFSLFYGRNEAGKSLTLEALLLLLTGGSRKKLFELRESAVQGKVIAEYGSRTITVTPSRPLIRQIKEVRPEDFRNIFVVYASDLLVEDDALRDERLSGIRRGFLKALLKQTKNILDLTNTLDIKQAEKALERDVRKILSDLTVLIQSPQVKELSKKEAEMREKKRKIKELENQLELLKEKKLKFIVENALRETEEVIKLKKELQDLEKFTEDEFEEWKKCEARLASLDENISTLSRELTQMKSRASDTREKIDKLKGELARSSVKEEKLLPLVEKAKTLQEKSIRLQSLKPLMTFLKWFSASAFVGGAVISTFHHFAGIPIISAGLIGFIGLLSAVLKNVKVQRDTQRLLATSLELGVKAESPEQLITLMAETKNMREKLKDEITRLEASLESYHNQIKGIEDRLYQQKKEKKDIEKTLIRVESSSGVHSPEDYLKKLREKTEKTVMIQTKGKNVKRFINQIKILRDDEALDSLSTPEELLKVMEKLLKSIPHHEANGESLEGVEQEIEKAEKELSRMRAEAKTIEKIIAEGKSKIERVEKSQEYARLRASEILGPKLSAQITPLRLKALVDDLKTAHQSILEDQKLRLTLASIVAKVVEEEEKQVEKLFTQNELISHYFSQMTQGAYAHVEYNPIERKLYVISQEGGKIEAEKLSSGTYDQLYLSVRLALAQQLLKGEKGFLILDDPLIRSDRFRLREGLKILLNLSRSGWQILYFTAKEEVVKAVDAGEGDPIIGIYETPFA